LTIINHLPKLPIYDDFLIRETVMTKSKKHRQKTVNKIHDNKNMIVLGLTVATIILVIYSMS